jgi:polar amino acid transport system substrate-binding protein
MKDMNFSKAGLVMLTVASLLLSGCATTSNPSTQAAPDPNVLRVGIAPTMPPLAFRSGSDFVGVEPDLARALAADLGKTAEFVPVKWENLMDALLTGKVDIIMSGMTITQARLMRVNFSKPYLRAGQTILVRRTDATLIQITLFEPKTKIGAQKATTGDLWAKQNCPNQERKLYPTAELGARALITGQIDAFICDAPVNWWLASENEAVGLTVAGRYLTDEYLGWAVRKDDPELLEAANAFIDRKNASGELHAVLRNWIPYL